MNYLTYIAPVILLGVLVFVHELGHFIFAKLVGIKVLKFSIGFGPKIVSKTYGETEYILASVPLGGYVKMYGEDLEDNVSDADKDRSFPNKPIYKRVLVVAAGSVFNILFAAVVFAVMFMIGIPRLTATVGSIKENSPALKAGLTAGDKITAIDGKEINSWDEMTEVIQQSAGINLTVSIKRADTQKDIQITPEKNKSKNIFGEDIEVGLIGISPRGDTINISSGFFESIYRGMAETWDMIKLTFVVIGKMIEKVVPADTIGGPILIFQIAKKQADLGILNYIYTMAVISVNLGVFNLFPIPVLDGGHLVFLTFEKIRRKPLNDKIIGIAQRVGLSALLLLMAFAFYNDIYRLIKGIPLP
ncbi:membrane-associated zinc metalloprotease [Candidatus Magnetoovum chiemensis]|nr:membrane-associated zinc metalloprotease [Candidatus Magnetoovum chiemensis]